LPWRTAEDKPVDPDHLQPPTLAHGLPASFAAVTAKPDGQPPLALVVEDDNKAAELLRLQLERNGFRVVHAITAEAALELAMQECPDLITVDIMLPGMDGWTFIERFKQHPQFARVPVVIVSIVADNIRSLTVGASYVLQKPVGREALAQALEASGFPPVVDGEQRTVLVVDDDPKAVKLLGTYLKSAGYRILTASSWQDGIDLARSRLPDLIVLDLMMPEVNGFEVVEVLKRDASTAGIPIVIVTAKQVTAEDRARLGADVMNVIEKSDLNQSRLISEVTLAMNGKRA
jgi:CheY-like chemotaxis protein